MSNRELQTEDFLRIHHYRRGDKKCTNIITALQIRREDRRKESWNYSSSEDSSEWFPPIYFTLEGLFVCF